MNVINRYLAAQVLMGLGIATVVLLPLFGFLDLLDQLDDVGKGTYRVQDAFLHTALLLPRRFIQLAPFIALLGNVIALGRLAVGSELTALRVAGVSPIGISLAPLAVGLILLLFIAVLDQFVAPQLQQKAISSRAVALEKSAALGKNLGIWTRDERNILRIGEMLHAGRAADIEIMHFDDNGFLLTYTHAKYADFNGGDLWDLQDVTTKTFTGNRIESVNAAIDEVEIISESGRYFHTDQITGESFTGRAVFACSFFARHGSRGGCLCTGFVAKGGRRADDNRDATVFNTLCFRIGKGGSGQQARACDHAWHRCVFVRSDRLECWPRTSFEPGTNCTFTGINVSDYCCFMATAYFLAACLELPTTNRASVSKRAMLL